MTRRLVDFIETLDRERDEEFRRHLREDHELWAAAYSVAWDDASTTEQLRAEAIILAAQLCQTCERYAETLEVAK